MQAPTTGANTKIKPDNKMKKNIIAITTAGILSFTSSTALRAEDQKPAASEGGGCSGGACHKGDKTPDPTPTPTPKQ